jgi:hypothetical protein
MTSSSLTRSLIRDDRRGHEAGSQSAVVQTRPSLVDAASVRVVTSAGGAAVVDILDGVTDVTSVCVDGFEVVTVGHRVGPDV